MKPMYPTSPQKGFTILEVMLVIASLNLATGTGILALNPGGKIMDMRNEQRASDVATIVNAVHEYASRHTGKLPAIPTANDDICRTSSPSCAGVVNLQALVAEGYLTDIPTDPLNTAKTTVGYVIRQSGKTITVSAPFAERGEAIFMSR